MLYICVLFINYPIRISSQRDFGIFRILEALFLVLVSFVAQGFFGIYLFYV